MAYRLMDRGSPCLVAFADISSLPPVMHEKTRRLTIDVYHVGSQGRTQHSRILCSAAALFHPHRWCCALREFKIFVVHRCMRHICDIEIVRCRLVWFWFKWLVIKVNYAKSYCSSAFSRSFKICFVRCSLPIKILLANRLVEYWGDESWFAHHELSKIFPVWSIFLS